MSSSTWMWSKCGPGSEKLEKNKRDLKYDAIHILVIFNEFDSSKWSVLYLNIMVRYMWHEQLIYIYWQFQISFEYFLCIIYYYMYLDECNILFLIKRLTRFLTLHNSWHVLLLSNPSGCMQHFLVSSSQGIKTQAWFL